MTTRTTALEPALRPLPLRIPIIDGESVDSWLEELARRHRLTLRALLPALGITATTPSTIRLIYGIDPPIWRQVEQVTGLPAGRLDSAVGDPITVVTRLRSGGSRYCPRCLADTDGCWQLSWRLNWTVACLRHRLLLLDRCPRCAAAPRVKIVGGRTPIPRATCTHTPQASRRRCGTDLTRATAIPVTDEILAVQHWIQCLITHLSHPHGHSDRQQATNVFADLPAVVSWLLLRHHEDLFPAARRINPDRPPDRDAERRSRASIDAALTATTLVAAKRILDGTDRAAIATLRRMLAEQTTAVGVPPRGMAASRWQALRTRFPNRYLRAADPDLAATQRLRTRSMTPAARHPDTEVDGRVRQIPQMLWPDWAARLLPTAGFHPELFRAAFSVCLLIPGRPERDLAPLVARLNPRVSPGNISLLLQGLADLPGDALTPTLIVLCRIADHLDQAGPPIDYQRRREQVPAEPITWNRWRDLACSVGAHPGDRNPTGRILLAQRHLHHLITGVDLANPQHPLAFRNANDRNRYIDFTVSLTQPLRQALCEHAAELLAQLGIDEPLTWSPPAHLADGLVLPGIDTDTLDIDTISPTHRG